MTFKHDPKESEAKRTRALYCEVDAKPLERYRKGGYHPTHLGDTFKDGRYKVIHKLGWGGYATVWLARDFIQEVRILEHLSQGPASHPGKKHIIQLLDRFEHTGPNGTHPCLVFEPLGPNVLSKAELYTSNRLPGKIAWEASRQTTQALAYIHANGITHGDLHPGNIVFADTTSHQSDAGLPRSIGEPKTSDVIASSGYSLTAQVPKYLVLPASCPTAIFELVVGYPPFDNFMPNQDDLIREWVSMFGDVPEEWRERLP
ncbi:MAG: hypothetical protein Q9176_005030 [Flavoplaca citrina]